MTNKKFTLADFQTKSLSETSTKMPIHFENEDTGCYLMVKGIESKSVQRARIVAQVAYADLADEAEKIKDKVDKELFIREQKENIEIDLACQLITGWSFDDFSQELLLDLMEQNTGLAFGVIAHATTPSNYLAK